uniref:Sulfate_transp domain-containing protein n=1 Tax=Panagrellus redivivus TaxID=6233 RepID=A0A7E4W1G0_PANRE
MTPDETPLRFKASDIPPWNQSILLGLQQTMVTIGGCLVTPFIISGLMCAGPMEATIRARLISVSFVVTGFSTLLQTVFGLRLAVLQGPSSSFIPALIAFLTTRKTDVCHDPTTGASPEYYYDTLNTCLKISKFGTGGYHPHVPGDITQI